MKKFFVICAIVSLVFVVGNVAQAGFDAFVIRDGASGSPTIQSNDDYVVGATEFVINEGGMKAALGSNDLNGTTIGDIAQLLITRYDDTSRYSAGSGPATAPYFNIWVTDGNGHYAVLANEPSNPDFQPLFTSNLDGSKTYDLSYADLADKSVQVYETPGGGYNATTTWVNDLFGTDLCFADVASLEIAAPPVSYIQDSENNVGTGAPDVLGTDVAYGFNWVFGDTLSNYVSDNTGYIVSDFAAASAVPEPGTLMLLITAGLGMLAFCRRS